MQKLHAFNLYKNLKKKFFFFFFGRTMARHMGNSLTKA